jgi:hypothetical protein
MGGEKRTARAATENAGLAWRAVQQLCAAAKKAGNLSGFAWATVTTDFPSYFKPSVTSFPQMDLAGEGGSPSPRTCQEFCVLGPLSWS